MITDAILDIFLLPTKLLLEAMPMIVLPQASQDTLTFLASMVHAVGVMIPFDRLKPIIIAEISIAAFNLSWAIALRIKSFVPTMGH